MKISPGEGGGESGTKGIYDRNRKVYTLYEEVFYLKFKVRKSSAGKRLVVLNDNGGV